MDISLDPIVARLSAQVSAFKHVAQAADFAAAVRDLKRSPSAFVLPLRETAARNKFGANALSQDILQRFGVAIGISNLRDATGANAAEDLAPIRLAVFDALLCWAPDADRSICEFGGGRIMRLSDQVLWWQDEYLTEYELRKT